MKCRDYWDDSWFLLGFDDVFDVELLLPLDDVGDVLKYGTKDEHPALQNLELRNRQLEPLRGMSLAWWIPCTTTDDLHLLQWELEEKGLHRFPWMSYEFWHVFYCFLICFNSRHPSQVAHPKKIERKVCRLHMIWISAAIFLGLDCFDCFDRSWSSPAMPEDWPTAIAPTSAYDMTSCDTSCGHRDDRDEVYLRCWASWWVACLLPWWCALQWRRLCRESISAISDISGPFEKCFSVGFKMFQVFNWQLWHVMTCYYMLWHVMTCYDMLWHVSLGTYHTCRCSWFRSGKNPNEATWWAWWNRRLGSCELQRTHACGTPSYYYNYLTWCRSTVLL